MASSEQIIERFKAHNANGKVFEVVKIQSYLTNKSLSGSVESLGGSCRYELTTGESVNPRDDGDYEIVWEDRDSDELIKRIWK